MKKQIIYGSPMGSVGDIITLLPLINASDFTFQTDSFHLRCEILKENCKIEITKNFISDVQSIKTYGDWGLNGKLSGEHQGVRFLKVFGVLDEGVNLIPSIKLSDSEAEYGKRTTEGFNKPCLAFCPLDARFRSPISDWRKIIDPLKDRYTILYISKNKNEKVFSDDLVDFSDPEAYPIRNIAGILNSCKAYIGIDTGLTQLSVAAGCQTHVIHDSIGSIKFRNYAYVPEMWKGECKAFYYSPDLYKNLLDKLLI